MIENCLHKVNFFSYPVFWHVSKFHVMILGMVLGRSKAKGSNEASQRVLVNHSKLIRKMKEFNTL